MDHPTYKKYGPISHLGSAGPMTICEPRAHAAKNIESRRVVQFDGVFGVSRGRHLGRDSGCIRSIGPAD